jgi:hypothetical protein
MNGSPSPVLSAFVGLARAAFAVSGVTLLAACGIFTKAAAKDPMMCERDPSCAKSKGSYIDCSKQCVDNPECTDRCKTVQNPAIGHQ